jgi:ribose transport system ATP-binding protein
MTQVEALSGAVPVKASSPALRIEGVVKRFPGTIALRGVDLTVYPGEVHALLGANGAGKSTLIKILSRLYGYDEGTIEVDGQPFSRETAGRIAIIHQDLGLIDELTVADNIGMTAGFGARGGIIRGADLRRRAAAALSLISSNLSPDELVGELRRADKSMVAIARALVNPTDILILDEPTASLHEHEVGLLFDVITLLRSRGTAIVYVSHRLDEVFRIADRITVMRDGLNVTTVSTGATSPAEIVGAITGHRELAPRTAAGTPGEIILRAEAVQVVSGATASVERRRPHRYRPGPVRS